MNDTTYILGHAPDELRRLELQAKVLEPLTSRLLADVGLARGMSVLDIGTGPGDVAMLAAAIVGPKGRVLGIDRNEAALERARARANEARLDWLQFDVAQFEPGVSVGSFDLVVGRYVLMHQSDPAAFLRQAASQVTKGGVLASFEMAQSAGGPFSIPTVVAYDDAMQELVSAFRNAHADLAVGSRLAMVFAQADLPEPALTSEAPVGGSASILPEWIARTVMSVRSTAALPESGWQALADTIRTQAAASHSQLFGPRNVAGWVRIADGG